MFDIASSFNQDISGWDVSSVSNMYRMFRQASSFNQDISGWDVSNVTNMNGVFLYADVFNQDLSSWDVSSATDMEVMFDGANALSDENKCAIHAAFQTNSNWPYNWCEQDCADTWGGSAEVCDDGGFCSSSCPDCAEGALAVDGTNCYDQGDLDVLVDIATASGLSNEYVDVLEICGYSVNDDPPLTWDENGRLIELQLSDYPAGNCPVTNIPESISNLSNLEKIRLSYIDIQELPESITDLTSLTYFSLWEHDNLTGSIPDNIDNLSNLNYLSIQGTNMSGSIPTSVGNFTNLTQHFRLHNNNFSGSIPAEIGNLIGLQGDIRLEGNNFTGEIPSELGNLINLGYLNLTSNQLSGEIPASLCDLTLNFESNLLLSGNYLMPGSSGYPDCLADYVGTQTCPDGEDFDCAGICDDLIVDECGVCGGDTSSCTGCTDDDAYNYDPVNLFDDGSCVYTAAIITSIEDVPNDQGGRVYISFIKSVHDTDTVEGRSEGYQVERLDGETWVGVASYYAYGIDSYTIEVLTLSNYINEGDPSTSFRVLASMDEGLFMSDVMEGYSVDNLAPSIPSQLAVDLIHSDGLNAELTWSDPVDDDFSYFNIYRNEEVIGQTTMSTYSDPNPLIDADNVYSISAIDVNTNESDISAAV